ncbi:hypothetical protein BC826DRAFT_1189415 [Russula brevipes]|nr:hypothetical protein BC826DRAFT_1189415 [Russula brevipes]
MPHCSTNAICLPFFRRRCNLECVLSIGSKLWERSRRRTPIHKLDDDSLLNIFYLYRLARLNEQLLLNENSLLEGTAWDYERWWYKLAHVCQRWRCLILTSAPYLRLCLVCTHGMPVADMLAHSPRLPLMVYYNFNDKFYDHDITAGDEEEINHALGYRDRIRRVTLQMPAQKLQKFLMTIDDEFPILEDLMLVPPFNANTNLVLPRTFQAPQLRRLVSRNFGLMGFPLLATATGIVVLSLTKIHPSAYFPPNDLIQHLSHMPQLQILTIGFHSPVPSLDVERQLLQTPVTTHITLPNLRWFTFKGTSAYLEALLPRIAPPLLERFEVVFFSQLTFSLPFLLQFMLTAENLRGSDANLYITDDRISFHVQFREPLKNTLRADVLSSHLDWQVSSITQIFNALDAVCSVVENLYIRYARRFQSPEVHNEVDRTQWRRLFGSFSNVKTFHVGGFDREVSGFLKLDDGESPMELFPELNELIVSARAVDKYDSFIDSRRNTDRPVTLVLL